MRFLDLISVLAMSALASAGCRGSDAERGTDSGTSARVEGETVGDTTIVRTVSGSVWGDTARLVEDLRIGALDGREEVTFGRVGDIEGGRDGSIFIYDALAVSLRQFDSAGTFVRIV